MEEQKNKETLAQVALMAELKNHCIKNFTKQCL